MMNDKYRRSLLIAGFALSAGLVLWDRSGPAHAIEAPSKPVTAASAPPPAPVTRTPQNHSAPPIDELAPRSIYTATDANAFGAPKPKPLPPLPPPPLPPPPSAPPLPFRYIGKQFAGGAWEVYVAKPDRTLVVHCGDVLDQQYKVEAISPPTLVLTYLPMNQKQLLQIGAPLND
ncbi:hypothetical protein [Niveibacterium terrae]|uniref:hypothetical protein n=1 Tax=Niveibacterium terrae TaxID=3373598 RepID=UPI003A90538E